MPPSLPIFQVSRQGHQLLELAVLLLQGPKPTQFGDAKPSEPLLLREKVCSLIPSLRMISATDVPDSACRSANAICSSVKWFYPIRKTHPFW